MISAQRVTRPLLVASGILGMTLCLTLQAGNPVWASDYVVLVSGLSQPLGTSSDFSSAGNSYEVRWRHYNRGRTAFDLVLGYSENRLEGEIQDTIDFYERRVRTKNQLAQQQGGLGNGSLVAEYGTLEMIYLNVNVNYRILERARFSPTVSVGGGLYNWRVPFRLKFFNVPSFGEQRAFDPVETGALYSFVFQEQQIDYTKHHSSGGLSLALGTDYRLNRHWTLGVEARTHLIFSSGDGNKEEGVDDQDYLDRLTFLFVNLGVSYRF